MSFKNISMKNIDSIVFNDFGMSGNALIEFY